MINSDNGPMLQAQKEVIVDFLCGMSVLRGADVFIQGIMGAPTSMLSLFYLFLYVYPLQVEAYCPGHTPQISEWSFTICLMPYNRK